MVKNKYKILVKILLEYNKRLKSAVSMIESRYNISIVEGRYSLIPRRAQLSKDFSYFFHGAGRCFIIYGYDGWDEEEEVLSLEKQKLYDSIKSFEFIFREKYYGMDSEIIFEFIEEFSPEYLTIFNEKLLSKMFIELEKKKYLEKKECCYIILDTLYYFDNNNI